MAINIFDFIPVVSSVIVVKLVIAAIIIIGTRILIARATPIIHDLCKKNNLDHHNCHILSKTFSYTFTIFSITLALQNLGIDVSMLIAAFGITGIVLSYGMKDIVANFIAGILIMGYKHIKIDDYVKIKDWEGQVVDINLRYTTLRHNNMQIFIPNLVLYTETVGIVKLIYETLFFVQIYFFNFNF
jgi:small-conductance mechanosensitive channel